MFLVDNDTNILVSYHENQLYMSKINFFDGTVMSTHFLASWCLCATDIAKLRPNCLRGNLRRGIEIANSLFIRDNQIRYGNNVCEVHEDVLKKFLEDIYESQYFEKFFEQHIASANDLELKNNPSSVFFGEHQSNFTDHIILGYQLIVCNDVCQYIDYIVNLEDDNKTICSIKRFNKTIEWSDLFDFLSGFKSYNCNGKSYLRLGKTNITYTDSGETCIGIVPWKNLYKNLEKIWQYHHQRLN